MKRRSFAVIGLGRFGAAMATTLVELGQEVIGIDTNGERVQELADTLTQTVELDAVDSKALRAAGSRTSTWPSSRLARTSRPACSS